jgi:hypothetical protein
MSQRECSGFNTPGFAIAAGDEVEGGPEANETVLRLLSVFPAGL